MNKSNIFAKIPKDLPQEIFENIIVSESVKIERIISDGHTSPKEGWYDSELNEWVILLQGNAVLEFKDAVSLKLDVGDFINIPAHTKHKVTYTSSEEKTVWLAVHYTI